MGGPTTSFPKCKLFFLLGHAKFHSYSMCHLQDGRIISSKFCPFWKRRLTWEQPWNRYWRFSPLTIVWSNISGHIHLSLHFPRSACHTHKHAHTCAHTNTNTAPTDQDSHPALPLYWNRELQMLVHCLNVKVICFPAYPSFF